MNGWGFYNVGPYSNIYIFLGKYYFLIDADLKKQFGHSKYRKGDAPDSMDLLVLIFIMLFMALL